MLSLIYVGMYVREIRAVLSIVVELYTLRKTTLFSIKSCISLDTGLSWLMLKML